MITYQEIFKHGKNVKEEQILQKKARSQKRSNYIFLKCTSRVSEYHCRICFRGSPYQNNKTMTSYLPQPQPLGKCYFMSFYMCRFIIKSIAI